MRRVLILAVWCYAVWVLLTWTLTAEQLAVGAAVAVAMAAVLAPTGEVAAPWALLQPRRVLGELWLLVGAAGRIVIANCKSELLYHAVVVPAGGPAATYDAINGPVERTGRQKQLRL